MSGAAQAADRAYGAAPESAEPRNGTIVYVASTAPYLARIWFPLMERMVARGWRVVAVAADHPVADRLREQQVDFRPLPFSRAIGAFRAHVRSLRGLYGIYRQERPDLVHHFTANPVIYGTIAARVAGVPRVVNMIPGMGSVFSSRAWDAPLLRAWLRTAYRAVLGMRGARTVFQNDADRAAFEDWRLVSPGGSAVVGGAGVDVERYRPVPEPEGDPVVLFCGRMLKSKGVLELMAAAEALRGRGLRFRLVLVGREEAHHQHAIPAAAIESWRRDGLANWLGLREDMPEIYAAANIVVLPSYGGEGMSNVLIEAAASGRAVVASDIAGCRDVVRHGRSGFLVPPRDVRALAAALEILLRDPARRAAMGRSGRELAVSELSRQRRLGEMASLYASLGAGEP